MSMELEMLKKIEEKLNKEYQHIGKIKIEDAVEEIINPLNINFIGPIMNGVEPLNKEEPIIVSKSWEGKYELVDGYHRLKFHLVEKNPSIKAIVLNSFKIDRKNDTLFDFLQSLVGNNIRFLDDETFAIDERIYFIQTNEGCGGCSSGYSSFELVKEVKNKDIQIQKIESKNESEDCYDLYINDIFVARVDTGWGNGYYGGDFEILT